MRRAQEDLAPLFTDGAIHEVMAIMPTGVLDLRTNSLDAALDFVQRQDAAGALGLYVGTNPLEGRVGGPDRTRPNSQNVETRTSLFLDFDRAEASKHLATPEELAILHEARQYAQDFLATRLGFPRKAARSGVSGNGEYLIYQLQPLPADPETHALIKRAVRALKTIIETEYPTVKLDNVTDAVRVRRISGTINRKHHDAHRMCLLDVRHQEPVTKEMLEALAALAPIEERATSTQSVSLSLDDQGIIERLQRKEKYRALLTGDKSGYSDYSSARYALAGKLYFEHADEEQVERILRTSDLFNESDNDRERDRKAARDARKRVSEGGPQRDPAHGSAPYLSIVTMPAPPAETATGRPITPTVAPVNTADLQDKSKAELLAIITRKDEQLAEKDAHLQAVQAERALTHAFMLKLGESNHVLLERIRRADEREVVYKNTKLGAARNVGAVLGAVLETLTPKEPDSPTPYRLYLDRLADETNQSPETSSRQLKDLAKYEGPNGQPLVIAETRKIPRRVDETTGEILGPTKEVWVGLTCEPSELTRLLGTLKPDNAPKHGGAPDRVVCEDHPDAGVIRSERNTKHIDHKCAYCRKVVSVETVTGPTTTTHLDRVGGTPVLHDADKDDEWFPEPFAHRPHEDAFPILHDADKAATAPLDQPSNLQHAGTTVNHTSLICKMKDRDEDAPSPVLDRRSAPAEPPWLWDSPPTDDNDPPPGWQEERRRAYGQVYRGEETG